MNDSLSSSNLRVLITADEIEDAVHRLGAEVSERFSGRPLTIVGVLTGAVIFVADLIRSVRIPHRIGFVQASSYRGEATAPGALRIDEALLPDIAGRDVLLVDDIFDTGRTLERLVTALKRHGPARIVSAVLLWKEGRQEVHIEPDYFCFRIPNRFVVGYGLDYDDDYRHLPFVAELPAVGGEASESEGSR
ncbi:MAG: hypoxanthine phosphoribosyltransferase [Planctomycetota bacterium]|nr:MAG: hypoxanthine phosphoribosyltransferase [Planctomycetota bacterium]